MEFNKIIIAPKMTGLEYDMHQYKCSYEDLIVKYKSDGADIDRIIGAHERQKKYFNEISQIFSGANILSRNQLTTDAIASADLVISFGGDQHTTYVSHFLDKTLFLPINSDPLLSEGALTVAKGDECANIFKNLALGDYEIEKWGRLEAKLNGKILHPLAIGEIYMGKIKTRATARYNLYFKDKKEEQKSNGLLISTGAGSTGWYDSAVRAISHDYLERGNTFPKTASYARFVTLLPYRGRLNEYSMLEGKVEQGEEIKIQSLKDSSEIAIDPEEDDGCAFPFNRGSVVIIKCSDKPLNVIRLINPS